MKLEKAGASYKGKCPFHNEKTPSFFVSPARGNYYCFGCGVKGDIFTFVQELEGVDFLGALKLLAEKAGVVLEQLPQRDNSEREKLFDILEDSTDFFEKNLLSASEARVYLEKRGLSNESIKAWRIGYIPNEWRLLYSFLKAKSVSENDMEKAGLLKRSDKGGGSEQSFYDVFRGRIMFPIFERSGRVIAFSGRSIVDDPKSPKYLNSPETVLFHKSETLYGLDRAKLEIKKRDYTILVEGQMDILMCHQSGFINTVASSGTAFTKDHLAKLQNLSNRITLAFDSDKAGFAAANKSAVLALSMGMEVKIVTLPKGMDPAELILRNAEDFKTALRNSKHLIDFYLDNLIAEKHDNRVLAKEIEKKVLPYIGLIASAIEQSHFVSQVAKKTGIREEAIWNDLRKVPKGIPSTDGESPAKVVAEETKRRKNYIERRLVGIVFWQDGVEGSVVDTTKLRVRLIGIVGDQYVSALFKNLEHEKEELTFEAESYYGATDRINKDVEELFANFEEDIINDKLVLVQMELQDAESKQDGQKKDELMDMFSKLSRRKDEIKIKRANIES